MVKRRSFNDIDISKDFEKRYEKKQIEIQKEIFEIKNIDFENMTLKELELYKENEIEKLEYAKDEDITSKILLEDVR